MDNIETQIPVKQTMSNKLSAIMQKFLSLLTPRLLKLTGLLLLLIIGVTGISLLSRIKLQNLNNIPLSSPAPLVSTVLITETSQVAKTENFKTVETNLESLQKDLNNFDLTQSALSYPLLEMNVNYEK